MEPNSIVRGSQPGADAGESVAATAGADESAATTTMDLAVAGESAAMTSRD